MEEGCGNIKVTGTGYGCAVPAGSSRVRFSGSAGFERPRIGIWLWSEQNIAKLACVTALPLHKPCPSTGSTSSVVAFVFDIVMDHLTRSGKECRASPQLCAPAIGNLRVHLAPVAVSLWTVIGHYYLRSGRQALRGALHCEFTLENAVLYAHADVLERVMTF